jgi:DNA-binding LacI/PurR family transcriptional regulator
MSSQKRLNRKAATMRDVAKLANVSQSTVSRVLSGVSEPIPIGDNTRRRVMEAVEELQYQPNIHAGSLRGKKTRMIAILIADITNPFYHPMIRAVQDIARTHRYDIMIANSDHTLEGERSFVESVSRRPVDGIVMVPFHLSEADLEDLMDRTGAVVGAVGQHINLPQVDIVYGDDRKATFETVTWLHEKKGHKKMAYIGVADHFAVGVRRLAGFEQAIRSAGLKLHKDSVQIGDWSPESGRKAMKKLLGLPNPPTAVAACNDLMAIGAMEAAKDQGLRIPEDVAVVGFDDIPIASWVSPKLSTIAQCPDKMGEYLTQAIFERIDGEYNGPARRIEVPCTLIEREST